MPAALSLGSYFPDMADPQAQVDVSVVIPTILRPCLGKALDSVFAQAGVGRLQVLIGVDKPGNPEILHKMLERRPAHVSALVLTLPYSTSARHGGPHSASDGGATRSILSLMANSRYVAYLDDDNAWLPTHLAGLLAAIPGKAWAFSRRMLIEEETGRELAVDRWDSLGVNKGRFAQLGGMVDPNCLMVDKVALATVLGRWSETADGRVNELADRNFFAAIREQPHAEVAEVTVRYGIRRTNVLNHLIAGGAGS